MSRLKTIEDALVLLLATTFTTLPATDPALEVRGWPDKPNDYRMQHPVGAVLVTYAGDKLTAEDSHPHVHEQVIDWRITLMARNLREHTGIYELVEKARTALLGYSPPHVTGTMRGGNVEYSDYSEGVWTYTISVSCATVLVIEPISDVLAATITQVVVSGGVPVTGLPQPAADGSYGSFTLTN